MAENEQKNWGKLFVLREQVLPGLEQVRQTKIIGKSLEAKLALHGPVDKITWLSSLGETLRELLNVSQLVSAVCNIPAAEEIGEFHVEITKADDQKCERCWHWEPDVGETA